MTAAAPAPVLLDRFLAALQATDVGSLALQFAASGRLRMGDAPLIVGRDAIRRAFVRLLARVVSLRAAVVHQWSKAGVAIVELDLTILRDDGLLLTSPVTIDLWINGPCIQACRFLLYDEVHWPGF